MRRNWVALDQSGTRCVVFDHTDKVQSALTAYELSCAREADEYTLAHYLDMSKPPHHVRVTLRSVAALRGECCYGFYCKPTEQVKIGRTGNVFKRWSQLECSAGRPLQLVAVWKTKESRVLERSLHAQFAADRRMGEWFTADPVLSVLRESALTYRTNKVTHDRAREMKGVECGGAPPPDGLRCQPCLDRHAKGWQR